jgi:putative hydrolase of the HAD superfamily
VSPRIRVVLSDLDDTLFDHHRATRHALLHVTRVVPWFETWSLDELDRRHREQLEALHVDVLAGRTSTDDARVERFRRLLAAASGSFGEGRAADVARAYRQAYETCWHPVAGARDLLAAIKAVGLSVAIVTNNQLIEQQQKIERLCLTEYIDELVTSEEVGSSKPAGEIFQAALERTGASADHAVMVGDAWATDIDGARAAGVRAVWLNRFGQPSPDRSVSELVSLEPTPDALRVILMA